LIVYWNSPANLIQRPPELARRRPRLPLRCAWVRGSAERIEKEQGQLLTPILIQLIQKFGGIAEPVLSGFVKQAGDGGQVADVPPIAEALPSQGANPFVRMLQQKGHLANRFASFPV